MEDRELARRASVHEQEKVVEAIKLRLEGVAVKEIARLLDVSVGWASENLGAIKARPSGTKQLLRAELEDVEADNAEWGSARASAFLGLNPNKVRQRRETIDTIKEATDNLCRMPVYGTKGYARLDQLQQLFWKEPGSGVFQLVKLEAPLLIDHLVGWKQNRHGVTQDKSDERFEKLAVAARDYVVKTLQPPSYASSDEGEVAAARWLGRWIANARSRGERRRNVARADLFLKVGVIIDGLRSTHGVVNAPARKAVKDGTWGKLFDEILKTKNSYEYEK